MRKKKDELISICKKKGLATSGTKEQLCSRIGSPKNIRRKSPSKRVPSPRKSPSKPVIKSHSSCMKKKKDELISICKQKGLATSGTKEQLCSRIMGKKPQVPNPEEKQMKSFNFFPKRKDCALEHKVRDPLTKQCKEKDELLKIYSPKVKHKWLEGPISLTELYSERYNKHVYLFGDHHVRETTCQNNPDTISIKDLINKTCVINSDQVIDLFGEVPIGDLYEQRFSFPDIYLRDIDNLKTGCGHRKNTECAFDNVRFHYSDMRQSYIPSAGILIRLFYEKDFSRKKEILQQGENEFMEFYGKPTWKKEVKDLFFKIKKQIDNIQYPELYLLLIDMYEDVLEDIIFVFERVKTHYTHGSSLSFSVGGYLGKVDAKFTKLLDVYILSRMFRTFNQVKDRYSEPPKNIIIYAGDLHSQALKRTLTSLGFHTLFETSDRDGSHQCLDISKLQQPLFSSL
jgi:hypothetical protein